MCRATKPKLIGSYENKGTNWHQTGVDVERWCVEGGKECGTEGLYHPEEEAPMPSRKPRMNAWKGIKNHPQGPGASFWIGS